MKKIEEYTSSVTKSTILQRKLVYHRGRAEEHFALYSDYNNRYFNTKYCGGVDDIKKMKRGMNSHVKHFTHHDSIAQDASREYEKLQQHSDLMQQQLKLTLLGLQNVIETQITKTMECGKKQLQDVMDSMKLSPPLADNLEHTDPHLIAQEIYRHLCSIYKLNTDTSPVTVESKEPNNGAECVDLE